MAFATVKKISTQECYNNEFEVLSLHESFDNALNKSSGTESVIEVSTDIKRGYSINENGQTWTAQA